MIDMKKISFTVWKNSIQPRIVVIIVFLSFVSPAKANVGGTFYNRSIAGLMLDSGATIKTAKTTISCDDTLCSFNTAYKTNTQNAVFSGRFYGVRFENIHSSSNAMQYNSDDSNSWPNNFFHYDIIESLDDYDYLGGDNFKFAAINVDIGSDSTFTIEGDLRPRSPKKWGLAQINGMSALRHPLSHEPIINVNEYALTYCFAPIQSFSGLDTVAIDFVSSNIELKRRNLVFMKRKETLTFDNESASDQAVFVDSIPQTITYYFKSKSDVKNSRIQYFTAGGPLLYLGSRLGIFHSEIGWEAGINAASFAILPSANASFNSKGYKDFNVALRLMWMGLSVGIINRSDSSIEPTFGASLGVIGFEIRSKGGFLHISL